MRAPQVSRDLACKWSVSDLSAFYLEHRSSLVARANRHLRDPHRSEEVAQEALLRIILASPELNGTDHALAYLLTTVDNLCTDIFRQEGRRPNLVVLDSVSSENEIALQDVRDHSDIVAAADDAVIVRQALSLLSPAERAALVMWEIEGRSTQEIAAELGVKESTVRHTVSRARASLRRVLSEYVIDESKGLTALDLLSNSYRKVAKVTKDGSRVALSFVLLMFAYLGFTNLTHSYPNKKSFPNPPLISASKLDLPKVSPSVNPPSKQQTIAVNSKDKRLVSVASIANARAFQLSFPGLDKNGSPLGFTVTDASGKLGTLYFNSKDAAFGDDGVSLTFIAKTATGAANIFLTQVIYQDANGSTYYPIVSFGRQGAWIPLSTKVISSEFERLASGNYLLTAVIQVKSEVVSSISIPAYTAGRDLDVAPVRVVTRILLNASKTEVIGQAVMVVERDSK